MRSKLGSFERFLFVGKTSEAAKASKSPPRPRPLHLQPPPAAASKRKREHLGETAASAKVGGGGLSPKLGSRPLRLIFVGHNPSEHAWKSGHYYSNPSNRFWKIVRETGIAPDAHSPEADSTLQETDGIGFIDVGVGHPGTISSEFSSSDMERFSKDFYACLDDHLRAAGAAPRIVAFTGKRQFVELLNANSKRLGIKKVNSTAIALGVQHLRPRDWPFGKDTQVWVLTSTSGASALTNEARTAPYAALSQELAKIPWPLPEQTKCQGDQGGGTAFL